jgi:hypothetical protein
MLRFLVALVLAAAPSAAGAGLRAIYDRPLGDAAEVLVADNGNVAATLWDGRRLIVRSGEAFIVEERLTGPIVTRLADYRAVLAQRSPKGGSAQPAPAPAPSGRATVSGREGDAFGEPAAARGTRQAPYVLSEDPLLAALGPAMLAVIEAEEVLAAIDHGMEPEGESARLSALLRARAPLRLGERELQEAERRADEETAFALPAAPESLAALRARRAREKAEQESVRAEEEMVQAVFADGQLWLVSDKGRLWSVPDGGGALMRHKLGEAVLDLCTGPAGTLAVTGTPSSKGWTVHRLTSGGWRQGAVTEAAGDGLRGISCGEARPLLLTSKRLIRLGDGKAETLALSEELNGSRVRTVVHAAPDALFVGFNSGEWGGGMKRIDRRTGKVTLVERNATGELCDGPLNAKCDPVHGIAAMPWRPDCVAAAVGLSHMMTHGRIVSVCGRTVEQLTAQPGDRLTRDATKLREVAAGGYGSVGFFDLAARGNALIAAGHDGVYRIEQPDKVGYRPWPRFKRIGTLLVSFDDPDAVLVLTGMNGRASVGGLAPLMAVRP